LSSRILHWVAHELREAIVPFVFFLAVFGLGRLSRLLLLEEYHVTVVGSAVAVVGALIVAKAILVAEALPLTNAFRGRALAYVIGWKALVYGTIAMAFHLLEELIPFVRKSGSLTAGFAQMVAEASWPHFSVIALWLGFAVVLYCVGREFATALGPERMRALMLGDGFEAGNHRPGAT
jgi:hypothetical protein